MTPGENESPWDRPADEVADESAAEVADVGTWTRCDECAGLIPCDVDGRPYEHACPWER